MPRLVQIDGKLTASNTTAFKRKTVTDEDLIQTEEIIKGIRHIFWEYYLTNSEINNNDIFSYNGSFPCKIFFPNTIEKDGCNIRFVNKTDYSLNLTATNNSIKLQPKQFIIIIGNTLSDEWELYDL